MSQVVTMSDDNKNGAKFWIGPQHWPSYSLHIKPMALAFQQADNSGM